MFLSYGSPDLATARELQTFLEREGVDVWMAPDSVRSSGSWAGQIEAAISSSSLLVVLISSASAQSAHVAREVNMALEEGKAVLPVRIEDVRLVGTLRYLLSLVQWVDVFPAPWQLHRDRLLGRLRDMAEAGVEKETDSPSPRRTSPRRNLPQPRDLVGREIESRQLGEALVERRMVTVVGTGGVGKTSLALDVAVRASVDFAGGVWMVELAPLGQADEIGSALITAMGLISPHGQTEVEFVVDFIGRQATLLVLDNCEHLLEPVAKVAQTLLQRCPNLRILATSRERLHLAEEQVFKLSPLALPVETESSSLWELAPALQLLRHRAKLIGIADPYQSSPQATVAVCRRLEGLPLAIELAASRLGAMSIEALDRSLQRGLALLAERHHGGPEHHSTMTAAIDWSYRLLDRPAQDLFPSLSILVGSFDLEAAAAAAGIELPEEAIEPLTSVVESSLLTYQAFEGSGRYRMLEPVRHYGQSLLAEAGMEDELRDRHAAYFLGLAREAEPHLFGHGQIEWLARLDREIDNLRAAFNWLKSQNPPAALDLAVATWGYWDYRDASHEGRQWLLQVLSLSVDDPERRFAALIALANIAAIGGDLELCSQSTNEAVDLAKRLADPRRLVLANGYLGQDLWYQGRFDQSTEVLQQVEADARQMGLTNCLAEAHHFLGIISRQIGDFKAALEFHQASRAEFKELGDLVSEAYAMSAIAFDLWLLGRLEEAKKLFSEADRVHRQCGHRRGVALGAVRRALLELALGNHQEAWEITRESVEAFATIGDRFGAAFGLLVLGRAALPLGDVRVMPVAFGLSESLAGRHPRTFHDVWDESDFSKANAVLGDEFNELVEKGRTMGWEGLPGFLDEISAR